MRNLGKKKDVRTVQPSRMYLGQVEEEDEELEDLDEEQIIKIFQS